MNLKTKYFNLLPQRSLAATAYIIAAIVTGLACVGFMKVFELTLHHRIDLKSVGPLAWIVTPLCFCLIVFFIRRWAPFSAGTGIPQAVYAAENFKSTSETHLMPFISLKTLLMKSTALLAAIAVGASTGREGPTVHIAMCVFCLTLLVIKKITGVKFDMRTAIVAGASAGLAAAFNTPLAGVAFAIEELSTDLFHSMKEIVLIAIIVAAITAKAVTGDYFYFGTLQGTDELSITSVVIIAIFAGLGGALFSTLLWKGQKQIQKITKRKNLFWLAPLFLGLALVGLSKLSQVDVMGPGNLIAKDLLNGQNIAGIEYFPFTKMLATLFTFWSGMVGGIFAPCLAIGAAIGATLSSVLSVPLASAALIGMAAFLAGTIQAPMTCFIIVFEMTNDHNLLLPTMLASLIAVVVARLTGSHHLYKTLASFYTELFKTEKLLKN